MIHTPDRRMGTKTVYTLTHVYDHFPLMDHFPEDIHKKMFQERACSIKLYGFFINLCINNVGMSTTFIF